MALTILSLNANGLGNLDKRSGLRRWLSSLPGHVDVLCLQEAHVVLQVEAFLWFSFTGFTVPSSPGSNCSCGVIILSKPSCLMVNSWSDQDGRFLMCEFSYCSKIFRIVNAYTPNRNPERNDFFDLVSSKMDITVPTVLCGDFNCVLDRSVDRRGAAQDDYSRESVWALSALFDSVAVTDVWCYLNPTSPTFTCSRWDGSAASRIDLIGCPHLWLAKVSSSDILPCPFSDHCAVTMSFSIPDATAPPLPPGLVSGNSTLLSFMRMIMSILSFNSGVDGVWPSLDTPPLPSGGMWGSPA